jgi:hypothetical protein
MAVKKATSKNRDHAPQVLGQYNVTISLRINAHPQIPQISQNIQSAASKTNSFIKRREM